jgi:septal ring factor EnvC (AmiA/AmiB activator)
MALQKHVFKLCFAVLLMFTSSNSTAQNNKQKQLENRRQELRREIQKINALRKEGNSKAKSQLSLIEDFDYKIKVLSRLIKVTNQQANLLNRKINDNQKQIGTLRNELKLLKENYAAMIVKSYKSRNQQSRIMFLLSSDNFKQAYKRLQYMKQYTDHQKEQGETIKAKTLELQKINKDLLLQKKAKDALLVENKKSQNDLEKERQQHQVIMASIRKELGKYTAQIRAKQREADKIDSAIDRIIKTAIAKSKTNKKITTKTASGSFALTPEEKVLSNNFASNKGKLPWPVENGYVSLGYGTQPHPINKSLTIKSNGVRINTKNGAKARAVFDGKVMSIVRLKNVNPIVMVQHGNYITTYKNLSKLYVKEGDTVKTKQVLGDVATNNFTGKTTLSFIVSKGSATQNPKSWIYKM